jgi:2-oxoisovalerate dehydrogenase E1 component beta subunit
MPQMTYIEAIRQGIWEEMERDDRVLMIGEDIGAYGGAFRLSLGMLEHFGSRRVVDTPLSENAFMGAAIGAAMMGLRPIVEMQFADFITTCYDLIVNYAAKARYRWGAGVPMVIRGPSGGGVHGGPFHSNNPEIPFVHTPGLKVVVPATAYDAKGLIKAAIRDPDPVLYFEHKLLYRRIKEDIPPDDYIVPLGQARIARTGKHVSIITYGAMLYTALEAAEKLAHDGVEVEVVDLRCLVPLDAETVLASVRKTNHVVLLHEDTKTAGFAGELAARIAAEAFDYLDAPVLRVTAPDCPVPYSPPLEQAFLPQPADVIAAVRRSIAY